MNHWKKELAAQREKEEAGREIIEFLTTLARGDLTTSYLVCADCKRLLWDSEDVNLCSACGWLQCRKCATTHWDKFPNYLTMEEADRDPDLPRCRYGHAPCSPYELEDLVQENAERSRKRKVM